MARETSLAKWYSRRLSSSLCTLAVLFSASQAWAFQILSPADGATVQSGQTVTASVDLGADTAIVQVRYYWYGEQAETLVQQDDSDASIMPQQDKLADDKYSQKDSITGAPVVAVAALSSGFDQTPPFGGALKVPKQGIQSAPHCLADHHLQGKLPSPHRHLRDLPGPGGPRRLLPFLVDRRRQPKGP